MEHWITAKRDDVVAGDTQDALTMASPSSKTAAAAPPGTPGTLAGEERVLCSVDSDSEMDGEEDGGVADVQEANTMMFEEQVVLPAKEGEHAGGNAGRVAVGAGQGGQPYGKDVMDGVEYFI